MALVIAVTLVQGAARGEVLSYLSYNGLSLSVTVSVPTLKENYVRF